ncbi:MAG: ABC transporter ATP-binding protein [Acidisphaera sp.]|nr:ABC transporter ATP-binding protein [Acidisphaera sp.]
MLVFEHVHKRFGALVAIEDVSLTIPAGLITSIIGPNGAGKSTLVNMAAGSYRVTAGRILLDDVPIQALPKHRVAHAGLRRTYQNIRLFDGLSVLENLEVAVLPDALGAVLADVLGVRAADPRRVRRAHCLATLDRFGLASLADRPAASLSYGNQKLVELARAVVAHPRALLLDEPAAGLNQAETDALRRHIEALRAPDLAIAVIEHDMTLVMALSDRVCVLHRGRTLAEGTPAEIQANPEVQEAYLGDPGATEAIAAAAHARRNQVRLRADRSVAWHRA